VTVESDKHEKPKDGQDQNFVTLKVESDAEYFWSKNSYDTDSKPWSNQTSDRTKDSKPAGPEKKDCFPNSKYPKLKKCLNWICDNFRTKDSPPKTFYLDNKVTSCLHLITSTPIFEFMDSIFLCGNLLILCQSAIHEKNSDHAVTRQLRTVNLILTILFWVSLTMRLMSIGIFNLKQKKILIIEGVIGLLSIFELAVWNHGYSFFVAMRGFLLFRYFGKIKYGGKYIDGITNIIVQIGPYFFSYLVIIGIYLYIATLFSMNFFDEKDYVIGGQYHSEYD
jgi:hypothetical protein